jgi:hypothetical protein
MGKHQSREHGIQQAQVAAHRTQAESPMGGGQCLSTPANVEQGRETRMQGLGQLGDRRDAAPQVR